MKITSENNDCCAFQQVYRTIGGRKCSLHRKVFGLDQSYHNFKKKNSYFQCLLPTVPDKKQLSLINLCSQTPRFRPGKGPHYYRGLRIMLALLVTHVPQLRSWNALHTHAILPLLHLHIILHMSFMTQFYSPHTQTKKLNKMLMLTELEMHCLLPPVQLFQKYF